MKITSFSNNLVNLVKEFESFEANPYLCPAGVPTIGYGSTFYPSGKRVTLKDKPITESVACTILMSSLIPFAKFVDTYIRDDINQNQFDALGDFVYNAGTDNLKTSSLLRKVNANPNDPTIRDSFMAWVFGGDGTHNKKDDDGDGFIDEVGEKQKLAGLVRRCEARANLYFS